MQMEKIFSGPKPGKQEWRWGMNQTQKLRRPKRSTQGNQEGSRFIETAGRWPRKSAAAKKCVTTYLPNESAPKMDGAQVRFLLFQDFAIIMHNEFVNNDK